MTRPAVLSLDAADTLFTERRSRAALYAEAFAAAGVPVDEADMARWMASEHGAVQVDGPAYSERWFGAFIAGLLRRAGSELPAEPLRRRIQARFLDPSSYRVYADVPPTLRQLTASGQRLVLVSNWSDKLPGLLAALGLAEPFEQLLVSQIVALTKPDPAIFRLAAERMGVPPGELLHVGNDPLDDVAAARRAGCRAWLLDRAAAPPTAPDVVRSLSELPARLT